MTAPDVIRGTDLTEARYTLRRWAEEMAPVVREVTSRISRAFAKVSRFLTSSANDPVTIAGLEGRYAVRAGLDPAYKTPAALDQLVGQIMAGHSGDGDDWVLGFLTRENRAVVAAAAIRGWCYSYGDGPAIMAWHRLLGTQIVVVTRG